MVGQKGSPQVVVLQNRLKEYEKRVQKGDATIKDLITQLN
jgi:hypothetical protein